jgi:serine/threonine protein kinase
MHEAFYNESKETMYLIMDLIDGKSLFDFAKEKKLDEENFKPIMG